MGNTKIKAANDLQKIANTFRGLLDLADELSDVGSLEQAGNEAAQHLHDLNKQIAEKEAYFAKVLQEGERKLQALEHAGSDEVADAKKEAQEILRKASNASDSMLVEAHKEAKKVKDDSRKENAKASLELADIYANIHIAKVELADLDRDIADRKRYHGDILKMIGELKAKF